MTTTVNSNYLVLAQASTDSGFKLPPSTSSDAGTSTTTGEATSAVPADLPVVPVASSRDMLIGGGIFFVMLLVFFFVKNQYANHLVAKRVAPSSASSASWLLFLGLALVTAALVLGFVNSERFISMAVTAPLVGLGIGAIIAVFVVGRR